MQVFEHALAVILPQMRDNLGVAMRGKTMTSPFEHLAGFGIIEEFAVEDDLDGMIFVANRLLAVRQADDAEPAIGQAEPGFFEITVVVGTAMDNGVGHALEQVVRHRPSARQIHHTDDTAHAKFLKKSFCRRAGLWSTFPRPHR